ncbi:MAG: hypothetical protein J7524_22825 [Roseofilum sp. Belize BBD 4]|uniref:hypothetical protein n=1 Tax=Roseofilum sp. Belize BBD 4 TaxID=2821500 RepID=UPI001B25049F|nr:hypothetical protein [Roseofilum sp. Belize BBD 4]MBP0035958.1 hypothetical protein [Roseofilum sp. Belize BBD 4]
MKIIIGNPEVFAIELLIDSFLKYYPFGGCRLWIEGLFLGDIDNPGILTVNDNYFTSILANKDNLYLEKKMNSSNFEIFELIENLETSLYWFLINVEGFECFHSYIYRQDDFFKVLWQLDRDLVNTEEYKNFSGDLFSAKVSIPIYEKVMLDFRKFLAEASPQLGLPLTYHMRLKIWRWQSHFGPRRA